MNLLSICQAVADEVDLQRPTVVFASSSPDAQKLLRYANLVGAQIMRAYDWPQLRKEQTFSALGQEEQTGILPSDFDRFVPECFWNRGTSRLVSGPVEPSEFSGLKAHGYSGDHAKFMIRGSSVVMIPSPGAGSTLAFEYVSNQWAESAGGTGQSSFLSDTDVFKINDELMVAGMAFQWLENEGQPSGKAFTEYDQRLRELTRNSRNRRAVMSAGDIFGQGRHSTGIPATSSYNGTY